MAHNPNPYNAYRPSGVEWLGDVPEHWQVRRGSWLFRKMNRQVRDGDEVVTCFRDGAVTLRKNRRIEGFTESLKEIGYQGVRKGDLVIHQMDSFAGAVGVSDSDGKGTPVYSVCQPTTGADAFYYAHIVREMARNQWIVALAKGIRERSTDFRYTEFSKQYLSFPPLPEQAAIVRYLDYVDRRVRRYVSAKERLISLLEEERQAVINRAVTRGLDPNTPLKPSGVDWLGDVPEHWEVRRLKRVLHLLIDCEHKTAPAVSASSYRVVRTSAVRGGSLSMAGTYCTSEKAFAEWTRRGNLEPGDVIFTREAPAGEACVVPSNLSLCLGQRTVLMKVDRNAYDPHFLVHMLYAGPPHDEIELASRGSTVPHFNIEDIGVLLVLTPPVPETDSHWPRYLDHETAVIDAAIARARRQIELIEEYRTRLIADVVTGKLDVREAAARLPDESDDRAPIDESGRLAENIDGSVRDANEAVGELATAGEVTV